MSYALIRIQGHAQGTYPDFAKSFDTLKAAREELAAWTDPMKESPGDYWSVPVSVTRRVDSTVITARGELLQRYDILRHTDGI